MPKATVACLLAATLGAVPAAAVSATPHAKTARFGAIVSATVKRAWIARGTNLENGCSTTERSSGTEQLVFRSRHAITVRVTRTSKGPVFSGVVGKLAGEFTSAGSTMRDPSDCSPSAQIADCLGPGFSFEDGRLKLQRVAPGRLALSGFKHEGEVTLRCIPAEATGSEDAPLGAVTGSLDERRLFAIAVRTLTVTGSVTRLVQLAGDATGQVHEEVEWKLSLRRLPGR